MNDFTHEPSRLNEARSRNSVSPGKDFETARSLGSQGVDVFVDPENAQQAYDKATAAIDEWDSFIAENGVQSPEGRVANGSRREARLVAALASQVLFEDDRSEEIANIEAELFDYYSPSLFRGAVRQKMKQLEALSLPADLEVSRAVLLDELEAYANAGEATELEVPASKTLEGVGNWLNGQFDDLFDELDEDGIDTYKGEQIVSVFQQAVDSTPALRESGWRVVLVDRVKNAISTYSSRREIVVPSSRSVTTLKLKDLVVHEVFGHALRSALAEQNDIPTAQMGTATYARFEESFMIALEQSLEGTYSPARGIDHYIATGLSVTEGKSKDEIARVFESMHQLAKAEGGIDDSVRAAAARLTGTQIGRTFAGFTDVDDGVAHRKDIDYLHGLNQSWELLNYIVEHDVVDEAMRWLLSAKFNPFTREDRELVNQYVPMPSALEAFFKSE